MNDSRLPPHVVVIDAGCALFAVWTVICNAVVLCSGTSLTLAIALAAAAAGLVVALALSARRGRLGAWLEPSRDPLAGTPSPAEAPAAASAQTLLFGRAGLLLAGELCAARFAQQRDTGELCLMAIALLALGYALLARDEREPEAAPPSSRAAELALWSMALACAAVTLCVHRPDSDDAFYVNLGVSLVDFPHRPLLRLETLHGTGAPFKIAAYRAPSIELASGMLSYLTGIRTLYVAHMVVPTICGFLAPFALARLLRVLDARRWPYAVFAVLAYLYYDGGARGSYGNFAFVRLFQGKAVLLTVALPLVLAQAVRFGLRPSLGRFALLSLAQIAALGSSVTGFWSAPIAAVLGVAAARPPRRGAFKVLAAAVLSAAYLLALGVYFKLSEGGAHALDALAGGAASSAEARAPDLLGKAYAMVLGRNLQLTAPIALALMAWPLCRTPLARRFALVLPLGFFALLGNPRLAPLLASLTTPAIHWRVVWLLPVPILFGLAASAALEPGRRLAQALRLPLCAAAAAFFLLHVSPRSSLARAHWAFPPHPKVDMRAYHIAEALVRAVEPHRQLLAPLAVSRVLPMLNGYGYPQFIKPTYVPGDPAERARRQRLTDLASHPRLRGAPPAWFLSELDHYRIAGLALVQQRDRKHALERALAAAGFRQAGGIYDYVLFTRAPRTR